MDNSDLLSAIDNARSDATGRRRGRCPRCLERTGKEDRHGALCVWPSGFAKCFKCKLIAFLSDFDGVPSRADSERAPVAALEGFEPLYESVNDRIVATSRCLEPARLHLHSRGIKKRVLLATGVGATVEGVYADRVVFPLLDDDGAWLGFVSRSWLKSSKQKYKNSTGLAREGYLYNSQALFAERESPVYVVEGICDALSLWPDAVALLGTLSQGQFRVLTGAARPIVFLLDGDAWEEAESLALGLRLWGKRVGAVKLPATLDPDELPRDEIEAAAREALLS